MRFTVSDWLLLIVACAAASVVMAGVTWALSEGLSLIVNTRSLIVLGLVVVIRVVIATLVVGLAWWLVLRRCVEGLRLGHWLLAVAIGNALHAAINLPTIARPLPLFLPLSGDPVPLLTAWLTVIAGSVATFLPPGLLLRRLTGANAWPFIGIASLGTILGRWVGPVLILYLVVDLGLSRLGMALVSGTFTGLILGAGLFLMARRPARPAVAG